MFPELCVLVILAVISILFEDETHAFGIQPHTNTPSYAPYFVIAAAMAILVMHMPAPHITEKDS